MSRHVEAPVLPPHDRAHHATSWLHVLRLLAIKMVFTVFTACRIVQRPVLPPDMEHCNRMSAMRCKGVAYCLGEKALMFVPEAQGRE